MIHTTVVGSWPPAPEFAEQLTAYHTGVLTEESAAILLRQAASVAIAQQCACGLQEYTGGETAADTFILHFPGCLAGVEPTADREAWGGRGTYRLVGPISAPAGLGIAAALRRERDLDSGITKVTFPGPSEITMRIEPEEDRRACWPAVIGLLRTEMRECVALGVSDLQLDLPHMAMGLADQKWGWDTTTAVDLIRQLFEGFVGVRRSIHLCYGDFGAQTWTNNRAFHPLLPTLQALDGVIDRVVLEFSLPEQWAERALLAQIPASIEVAVGIIDVKSPVIETVAEIQAKITELLRYVPADRLLICPSCGFGRRNPELAMAKTQAMVQAATSYESANQFQK